MAKLSKRVWSNKYLSVCTKLQACIISTLLYSSEDRSPYTSQEKRPNSFRLQCPHHILGITWQEKVPNTKVLERAHSSSVFAIPSQCRLRWLSYVFRMDPVGSREPSCMVSCRQVPGLPVSHACASRMSASSI